MCWKEQKVCYQSSWVAKREEKVLQQSYHHCQMYILLAASLNSSNVEISSNKFF